MIGDADHCLHLTVNQVLTIRSKVIAATGGSDGLRDLGLLESAVAAPQAFFGGTSPFADTVEVAAAYFFYLCSNHPFIDGNKRVALGVCLSFLEFNGYELENDETEVWENLTLAVAQGLLTREEIAERLRGLVG